MEWRLRHADESDAAALSLVASATFLDAFAGILDGPDIVEHCHIKNGVDAWRAWLADAISHAVIAEAVTGAAPIGYSLLTAPDLPVEPGTADIELKRIYTLSSFHGSGLGAAVLDRSVTDSRELGHKRLLLGVYGGNKRAQRFYEKHGFVVIGQRRFRVGATTHDDLVYARSL